VLLVQGWRPPCDLAAMPRLTLEIYKADDNGRTARHKDWAPARRAGRYLVGGGEPPTSSPRSRAAIS